MKWADSTSDTAPIAAGIFWGFYYLLAKLVLRNVPVGQFLFIRFTLSVAILTICLRLARENYCFYKKHLFSIFLLGVFGVGLYNVLWAYGVYLTTASSGALLIATSPIFTGIYSILFGKEKLTVDRWIGTVISFIGVFLVIQWTPGSRLSFESKSFTGDIIMLFAAILFSFYAIVAKPLLEYYSPIKLTTLAMTIGLTIFIPFGLRGSTAYTLSHIGLGSWLELMYIIIFGTVIAFTLWYTGIKHTSAVRTIMYHYLVPIISMIFAPFVTGERINFGMVLGAGFVFAGILLAKTDYVSLVQRSLSKALIEKRNSIDK